MLAMALAFSWARRRAWTVRQRGGRSPSRRGQSSAIVEIAILGDNYDEDARRDGCRLSRVSLGLLTDGEAMGTMDNRDPLSRARWARFDRTAAVQVSSTLRGGSRALRESASWAGSQDESCGGMERDLALSFLNQLGCASGAPRRQCTGR